MCQHSAQCWVGKMRKTKACPPGKLDMNRCAENRYALSGSWDRLAVPCGVQLLALCFRPFGVRTDLHISKFHFSNSLFQLWKPGSFPPQSQPRVIDSAGYTLRYNPCTFSARRNTGGMGELNIQGFKEDKEDRSTGKNPVLALQMSELLCKS